MKIVQINSCNFGSTGNIMLNIAETARKRGFEVVTCCAKSRSNMKKKVENQILIGNRFLRNLHGFLSKNTGYDGCFSICSTFVFLHKLRRIKPDILHLHNLHGCYINLPMLFHYIKRHRLRVVWTFHDCWAFTGHCPHFEMMGCEKWRTGCFDCPQFHEYPQSRIDNSRVMYKLKKRWFTGVENLTIVTPSHWLAGLVKQSYLGEYPVRVINNAIDIQIFKPTPNRFREMHDCKEKFVLLGVAHGWSNRKGLDVFIELADRLDARFQIVLVGTDEGIDRQLTKNIISVHRTQNQQELAEIYTMADLFLNPTREEVFGLVNVEALACGTPVVTFQSGGSPECIDETCGVVVEKNNIDSLEQEIIRVIKKLPFSESACIERAHKFDMMSKFDEYINLYEE